MDLNFNLIMSKFLRIKNKISQEKMKKSRKLVLQTLGA